MKRVDKKMDKNTHKGLTLNLTLFSEVIELIGLRKLDKLAVVSQTNSNDPGGDQFGHLGSQRKSNAKMFREQRNNRWPLSPFHYMHRIVGGHPDSKFPFLTLSPQTKAEFRIGTIIVSE